MHDDDRAPGVGPTADQIAQRAFTVVRKGLAEGEVRAWLSQVAAEVDRLRRQLADAEARAAQPVPPSRLSEDDLLAALGEETARVLRSAQEAADDIRRKAEDRAAALLREAQDDAAAIRDDAGGLLDRRTAEAEAAASRIVEEAEQQAVEHRVEADAYAAAARDDADTYADVVRRRAEEEAHGAIEAAKAQGRELVTEAQAVRERILGDLARRRAIAQQRVEELQDGSRRLLDALAVARRSLEQATDAVAAADAAELMAAGALPRAPIEPPAFVTGPHPVVPAPLDELTAGEPQAEAPAVEEPAAEEPAAGEPQLEEPTAEEPAAEEQGDDEQGDDEPGDDEDGDLDLEADLDLEGGDVEAHREADEEPAADDPAELDQAAADVEPDPAPPEPEPAPMASELDLRDDLGPSTDSGDAIEALFARLRATRADDVDAARAVLGDGPVAVLDDGRTPTPTPGHAAEHAAEHREEHREHDAVAVATLPRDPAIARRDAIVRPVVGHLVRQVKRALQDDQNLLLEGIRRATSRSGAVTGGIDELLPDHEEQLEAVAAVVRPALAEVWLAVGFAGVDPTAVPHERREATVDDLAQRFARELVLPLRDRLEAGVLEAADAATSAAELAERVGAHYREWKVQRTEVAVLELIAATAARVVHDAAPEGAVLRWVADGDVPCAECEDNALEPTVRGSSFPTGHAVPPAHPGCRCFLVVDGVEVVPPVPDGAGA
jgi:hypothetical protein